MIITETRVGGDRAAKIIEGLPYDGFFVTETIGYAGGLWLLWKKEEVEVIMLAATKQEIHATIKVCNSDLTWLISSIYSSPRLAERKILWENLSQVALLHTLPWLLLGDFNEILCGNDKMGGRQINLNRALEFKSCLDDCNFLDLGFSGPKYTWTNGRQVFDLILERIDRCFVNPAWRILFPEASVTHFPRVFYDHCHVLFELSRPLSPLLQLINHLDSTRCGFTTLSFLTLLEKLGSLVLIFTRLLRILWTKVKYGT